MPSDIIDDSKVVEKVNILHEITSIVEDALIDSTTPIIDEVYVFSDSTSDDVDEIVVSNILAEPSMLFKFPCTDYGFIIIPLSYFLMSHLSLLP